MLQILVQTNGDLFDEEKNEFIKLDDTILKLEHSLISISKWEQKWKKSFLNTKEKSTDEIVDYIRCMTLNNNVNPYIYSYLSVDNIQEITKYIEDPATATHIYNPEQGRTNEVITSELIYYWMITLKIPVEFEKWHLNRLLTLIQVCGIKNAPPKKMSKSQILRNYDKINEKRKSKFKTKG